MAAPPHLPVVRAPVRPHRLFDRPPVVFVAAEYFACASYRQLTHVGAHCAVRLEAEADGVRSTEELSFVRSARPQHFVEAFANRPETLEEMGFRLDPRRGLVSMHTADGGTCSVEEMLVDFLAFLADCRGEGDGERQPDKAVLVVFSDQHDISKSLLVQFVILLLAHLKHFSLEDVFLEEVGNVVDLYAFALRRGVLAQQADCRLSHLFDKVFRSPCPLEAGFLPCDVVANLLSMTAKTEAVCGRRPEGGELEDALLVESNTHSRYVESANRCNRSNITY